MAMGYRSAQPPSISPATSMQPDSVLFRFLRVFALLSAQFPLDLDFAKCEEFFMRIVSRKAIREATAKQANGVHYLNPWYEIAKQADWKNFAEVRNSWR